MKTKICSIFGLAAFVIALALPARAENTLPASLDALFAHGVKFTVSGYTNANGTVRSTPLQNFPVRDFAEADCRRIFSRVCRVNGINIFGQKNCISMRLQSTENNRRIC